MTNPFETQDKRGRPRVKVRPEEVASLKKQGLSFRQIARELGVGASTAHMLLSYAQKCPETPFKNSQEPRSEAG